MNGVADDVPDSTNRPRWTEIFSADAESTSDYISTVDAFNQVDWTLTSLGPLHSWPVSTRTVVCLMFHTKAPQGMFLGPERVVIYNSAASVIYRGRHPSMMGKPYREAWSDLDRLDEVWEQMDQVTNTGRGVFFDVTQVHFGRQDSGAHEESFFSYEFLPVMDDLGKPSSLLLKLTEHTLYIRQTQRLTFLALLHDSLSKVTQTTQLYDTCSMVFRQPGNSIPFVRLCSRSGVSSAFQVLLKLDLLPELTTAGIVVDLPDQLLQKAIDTQTSSWEVVQDSRPGSIAKFDLLLYPVVQADDSAQAEHVIVIAADPRHSLDSTHRLFLHTVAVNIANALRSVDTKTSLQRSERRFHEMIQRAPIGLNVEDAITRTPILINDAWRECESDSPQPSQITDLIVCQFDLPIGEIAAENFASIIYPSHRELFMEQWAQTSKHNLMHNRDLRLYMPYKPSYNKEANPDDNIWVRVTASWIPQTYKQSSSIIWTLVDISEDKYLARVAREDLGRAVEVQKLKSESVFERERADAAESSAAKHLQYIDFSSHELRNPLGAILQAADLSRGILEDMPGHSQDVQELLDHQLSIISCARHMGRIVDDTLSFSQLDHGALQIATLPCQLDLTTLDVLSMFRAELRVKKIHLEKSIAEIGVVLTDASRFSQILINILTNALKFAPHDGSGQIAVKLSTSPGPARTIRIECSVRDNGPGMSGDVLDSLFQKFSQASAKTQVQYGGSGLGLYISKILTERLGGQIEATSVPGAGTELSFHIYVSRSDEPAQSCIAKAQTEIERNGAEPSALTVVEGQLNSQTEKPVLLIVEDNIINQRLMAKILSPVYQVHTANNGLECLNLLKSEVGSTINLVLCDIEMPVMNGYEAVKEVKNWQVANATKPIPFLAVSANCRPEQVKLMLDAGMDDAIKKPFGRKEILGAVARMLSKYGIAKTA